MLEFGESEGERKRRRRIASEVEGEKGGGGETNDEKKEMMMRRMEITIFFSCFSLLVGWESTVDIERRSQAECWNSSGHYRITFGSRYQWIEMMPYSCPSLECRRIHLWSSLHALSPCAAQTIRTSIPSVIYHNLLWSSLLPSSWSCEASRSCSSWGKKRMHFDDTRSLSSFPCLMIG